MKVAIIGGGIAGLTCAYRLAQKGIKSKVFEKEVTPGGRIQWSTVVAGKELHPYTYNLVEEIGLGEAISPVELSEFGSIMPDGSLMKMEDFPKMVENFSDEEKAFFGKMNEFFGNLNIDVKNLPSELTELKEMSFAEYLEKQGCPDSMKPLLGLEINLRFLESYPDSWSMISAEYGMMCIAPFFTVIPKQEVYVFEENMAVLTNVLSRKIEEKGSRVETGVEVQEVKEKDGKFQVSYEKHFEEEREEFDKVVLATPLSKMNEIFPELEFETDIWESKGKCYIVEGELKSEYSERDVFFVFPGHESNICTINAIESYEHRLYSLKPEEEVSLDTLYDNYKILSEKELDPAWHIVPPKGKIPNLKTDMEGVYLCGDFYHFAGHDVSAATAEMVADMIKEEE